MVNVTCFATHQLFEIAKQAYQRVSSESEVKPHNDVLVAILFSAATLESFMSDAVFMAKTWSHLHPKIEVFAQFIGELESREVGSSLKIKYYMAHWIICGIPFDRGKKPYQDFDFLVDLRNALIHLKPDELASEKTGKLLSRLKSSNLISDSLVPIYDPNIPEQRAVWVHYVSTAKVAKWACNTAASMIQEFWKNAPENDVQRFFQIQVCARSYKSL